MVQRTVGLVHVAIALLFGSELYTEPHCDVQLAVRALQSVH